MKIFNRIRHKTNPLMNEEATTPPRPNFDLNLYSQVSSNNSNLLAIAESGAGKSFLFQQIINTEHATYGSTIQSVVFTDFASEYSLSNSVKTKVVELSEIQLNPFDLYAKDDDLYEAHTLDVLKNLIITIAERHGLSWNESTERELKKLVLQLIAGDEPPTMKQLYELVMERFYENGMTLQQYFQKGKEYLQLDLQDLTYSAKDNEFLILNEQYQNMLNLLYVLTPFMAEHSPYSTHFNKTQLPVDLLNDCDVVFIQSNRDVREIIDILASMLTVKLLDMHEALPTPRGFKKLAIYHDSNEGKFGVDGSVIYGALMERYLRKCRPFGGSLRISAQSISKRYLDLYSHCATILIGSTSKYAANDIFKHLFITDSGSRQIISTLSPYKFLHYSKREVIFIDGAKVKVMSKGTTIKGSAKG